MAGWMKKKDPTIYCLQEMHLIDKHWLMVKKMEKDFPSN
jgi:hypothetical protein